MKAILIIAWCIGLGAMAFAQENKLGQFAWLLGKWEMKTDEGFLVESWEKKDDSTLQGKSYMIDTEGNSVLLEQIELVWRQQQYFYIPVVNEQNDGQPVIFTLSVFDNKHFIAVNNDHDYPKRIRYELTKDSLLHAMIDDGLEKPQTFSHFNFTRSKKQ